MMKTKTRLLILCALVVVIAVSVVMIIITNRNAEKEKHPDVLTGAVEATLTAKVNTSAWTVAKPLLKSFPFVSSYAGLIDAGISIASNLTVTGTWVGSDARLGLALKGKNLVSAAVRNDGEKLILLSEVLPENAAASLTAEELSRLVESAAGSYSYGTAVLPDLRFSPEDLRTIEDAVVLAAGRFNSKLDGVTESEERGSWEYEGHKFGTRHRISAGTREIAVLVMESAQEALKNEKLSAFLSRIGINPDAVSLDNQIENLRSSSDESYPSAVSYRYRDGDDTYTEILLTMNGEEYALRFGTIGLTTYLRFVRTASNEGYILIADSRGYSFDFTANLSLQTLGNLTGYGSAFGSGNSSSGSGSYGASGFGYGEDELSMVRLTASGKTSQSGEHDGKIVAQYAGMDLVTVDYTIKKAESLSSMFDMNGRRILTYNDLTSQEFSDWLQRISIPGFLVRMIDIMPEAAAAVLDAMTGMMKSLFGLF